MTLIRRARGPKKASKRAVVVRDERGDVTENVFRAMKKVAAAVLCDLSTAAGMCSPPNEPMSSWFPPGPWVRDLDAAIAACAANDPSIQSFLSSVDTVSSRDVLRLVLLQEILMAADGTPR